MSFTLDISQKVWYNELVERVKKAHNAEETFMYFYEDAQFDDEYMLVADIDDTDTEFCIEDEPEECFLYGIVPGEDPLAMLITFDYI